MQPMDSSDSRSHPQHSALEKQLGLRDVYALAAGATLSSGFFLLPGFAAAGAGAGAAMPKAGGIDYFLDRSMGPLVGTIGGFGTWISLVLRSAFALVGVGAYLHLFFSEVGTRSNRGRLCGVLRDGELLRSQEEQLLPGLSVDRCADSPRLVLRPRSAAGRLRRF